MIRFHVQLEFGPQACGEAVRVLRSLAGPIRAEPGCTGTRLTLDLLDGRFVSFGEEWRDMEELRRHLHGPNFRKLLAVIDLASSAPVVEVDEILRRRGFDLVEEILGRPSPAADGSGSA